MMLICEERVGLHFGQEHIESLPLGFAILFYLEPPKAQRWLSLGAVVF